jgi:hypothetical protein
LMLRRTNLRAVDFINVPLPPVGRG